MQFCKVKAICTKKQDFLNILYGNFIVYYQFVVSNKLNTIDAFAKNVTVMI